VAYEVRETPEAKRVHEKFLKGAARKRYEAFLVDLAARGCKAGGKRLRVQGDDVSRYCARGFYARWRAHLVFEDAKTIVVFAIMEHTESSNPKKAIAEVLPEVSKIGVKRSEQPPCCEDFDDPPPPLDQAKVDLIEALL
jgi:mRNA-degrading endonuclease RelE of RelBE toxin-antitoxin system